MSALNRITRGVAATSLTLGCWLLASTNAFAGLGAAPMTTPAGAAVTGVTTRSPGAASTSASTVARAATQASSSGMTSGGGTAAASYTVRETRLASGTVVREYVGPDGTVFGVAWQGQQMPDLSALLGTYFPQYLAGLKANRAAGAVRGPATVEQSGLVVHSGGHMGAFSGQAWLPQALPAGVNTSDIQ
ncbi:DUF2844 domain-containing protein [Paraburkholderia kururiensis]|uniref:DUF2844 domain-containing protein n=1 Tax=Paraburkholderia kururiensis TaxID=984307 RepID=A0ABZ0WFP0_9BURK|nr:DUF2844 domain-containing protein [Paraburkholderia kururiensis]WQD76145.1 DUF2844 domain-containing protein [Paraburkholderia kururiensis]